MNQQKKNNLGLDAKVKHGKTELTIGDLNNETETKTNEEENEG